MPNYYGASDIALYGRHLRIIDRNVNLNMFSKDYTISEGCNNFDLYNFARNLNNVIFKN